MPQKAAPHVSVIQSLVEFLNRVQCADEMFEDVLPVLKAKDTERISRVSHLVQEIAAIVKGKPKNEPLLLDKLQELLKPAQRIARAGVMFRGHSIVLLVSQFDEFVAELLRVVYGSNRERLKGSGRTLSYDDFLAASSLDEIFASFIDREIDKIFRQSHSMVIDYLDEHFKIGIIEHFAKYPSFIEITERRNLIVHSGGVVTPQYLSACEKAGLPKAAVPCAGAHLVLEAGYFKEACRVFFEIGLRVGQAVLRRAFPEHLAEADLCLNDVGFDMLREERCDLASIVFEFALGMPCKLVSTDRFQKMFRVNLAIAYKWGGRPEKVEEVLSAVDWSASEAKFKLACCVLRDEFDRAASLVLELGRSIPQRDYATWPLFRGFRNSPQFQRAFRKVYRKPFIAQAISEVRHAMSGAASIASGQAGALPASGAEPQR